MSYTEQEYKAEYQRVRDEMFSDRLHDNMLMGEALSESANIMDSASKRYFFQQLASAVEYCNPTEAGLLIVDIMRMYAEPNPDSVAFETRSRLDMRYSDAMRDEA